jgi:hypothetical protein
MPLLHACCIHAALRRQAPWAQQPAVLRQNAAILKMQTCGHLCRETDISQGIHELQQRLLDMEKALEMEGAKTKQATREVRGHVCCQGRLHAAC